jgi:hypothetical protein
MEHTSRGFLTALPITLDITNIVPGLLAMLRDSANPDPAKCNQVSCEVCTMCIALDLIDWQPTPEFISWLEYLLTLPLVDNNWQWFGAIMSAYVKKYGGTADYTPYLKQLDRFYVTRGWYLDGNKYDMYSGWVMQFMPHFFSRLVPSWAEYFLRDHDLFLRDWACLFDEHGGNTQWGRSPIYKYAASNPFVACWFNPAYDSATTYSNLVYLNIQSYGKGSSMRMGAYEEGDCEVDSYSCKYSSLWSSSTLLASMLPADSKFFTGEQVEGWWSNVAHVERQGFPSLHIVNGVPSNQYIHFGEPVPTTHPQLDKRYIFND